MAKQQREDSAGSLPQNGETVESTIVKRRRLIQRAAWIGIPAMLTLHGRAFASGGGWSGGMSGSMSGTTQP